jgi:NAD(P)H-nitrite reductase large subunit
MNEHFVIIGNGAAANKAAQILRNHDAEARITLITDEFALFYFRHMLPDFVTGKLDESNLFVHPASFYKDRNIRLRLGQKVLKIDLENKEIFLQHMEKVHYSHLLLCTGGKPRIPEIHYAYRRHFTVMKSLEDARSLKEKLPHIGTVLIVGGDLVSVRLASALVQAHKKVFFLIDKESFWPLETTPSILAEFSRALGKKGITIVADDRLTCIESISGGSYVVQTARGAEIGCDMVGAFFGLVPDVGFLMRSGLDLDRGILVNDYLETSISGVFAAGDCAQIYNPALRNYWVSIGWPNAERLGEIAARNMLGMMLPAGEPPKNALSVEGISVNTSWWKGM